METDLIAGQQLKLRCERRMAECMGRTALRLTSAFPERRWNRKYVRWESKNMCLSNNRISLTPSRISVSAGPPFSRPGVTTGYENGTGNASFAGISEPGIRKGLLPYPKVVGSFSVFANRVTL